MTTHWFKSQGVVPGLRKAWAPEDADDDVAAAPAEVLDWLARLRLLHGVPFAYLVVDDDLLPPESIRFFWMDRDWTDAAVEGALSAAGAHSLARTLAATEDAALRQRLDQRERNITPHDPRLAQAERPPGGGPTRTDDHHAGHLPYDTLSGPAGTVTGFVLRSKAVSGWPELHVRALDDRGNTMTLLRVERLAPAVLLVLIDGCPNEVQIEEPRRGIQFGVDLTPNTVPAGEEHPDEHPDGGRQVALRDPENGLTVLLKAGARVPNPPAGSPDPSGSKRTQVAVPFREKTTGVVDMAALAAHFAGAVDANPGAGLQFTSDDDEEAWPHMVSTAELTTQLLQFPYQQRFHGDGHDPDGGRVGAVLAVTTPVEIVEMFTAFGHLE
ncbi:MAG TPA: hypothetical protein VEV43_15165 [Actinomycetota bacterium]|nr:hypothetical protein [Actinomycetota bacterium]